MPAGRDSKRTALVGGVDYSDRKEIGDCTAPEICVTGTRLNLDKASVIRNQPQEFR